VEAASTTVSPGTVGGIYVICPESRLVTGGGIGFSGYTPGPVPARIVRSNPTNGSSIPNLEDGATAGRWIPSIGNISGSIIEPTAFALCSANTDAVVEAQAFDVPAGQSASARATCPGETRVVGGGVGTTTASAVVQVDGPQDASQLTDNTNDGDVARSWFSYIRNGSITTESYRVFALCSKDSDAIVEATEFTAGHPLSDIGRATCPEGRRALGGGIGTTGPTLDGSAASYQTIMSNPVDETGVLANTQDGDVARGWQAAIFNQSGTLRAFKVMALCARDPGSDGPDGPGGPGGPDGPGDNPRPRCLGKRATIVGTSKRNRLRGTRRADVIVALGGNDIVDGRGGNDRICAGSGNDRVKGGDGNDRVDGGSGNDLLDGGAGKDRLAGGIGKDRLFGRAGRDRLSGGPGRDRQKQ
jgi:Ca2+-binding RTX toxin-like protein